MPAMNRALVAAVALAGLTSSNGLKITGSKATELESSGPVRKVLTLLDKMAKKIETQGIEEEKTYGKFQCYCKKTLEKLTADIAVATSPNALTQTDIDSTQSELENTNADVSTLKVDKVNAVKSLEEAVTQRDKDHEVFVKASTKEKDTATAAGEAIEILSGNAFLQQKNMAMLQNSQTLEEVISKHGVPTALKTQVAALLSENTAGGSRQSPDMAIGTLSEIKKVAEKEFRKLSDAEDTTVEEFKGIRNSKEAEIVSMTQQLQKKQERSAELRVKVVDMKADLKELLDTLAANRKMEGETKEACDSKAIQWTERVKIRNQEQLAIAETIKILNSDEALDTFRKAMKPTGSSLIQVGLPVTKALSILKKVKPNVRINLLSAALSSKAVDFSKVTKMIDDMIDLLTEEGKSDIKKRNYCTESFHENKVTQTGLARDIKDLTAGIREKDASIELLNTESNTLKEGIAELAKQIAAATETKKAETAEYKELVASNTAAIELLEVAKNRMNKFYQPHLYKGTTTKSPYDLTFMQLEQEQHKNILDQAPETFEGSYKNSGGGDGVLTMLTDIIGDLKQEMKTAKVDENFSQQSYEKVMNDANAKTEADTANLRSKSQAKANLEEAKVQQEGTKTSKEGEMDSAREVESNLHEECDWLLKNLDERKLARDNEILSLKDAKSTLAGAVIEA
eukprot:TRINITY_DN79076_c0_g1_i1.p1 TRINITY_DN79076_c0_g1~~TRINITY_DN79076_c0_g1_i1.p1  ORF type:complete len:684 (-),score=234.02 TRINITY_DN79076_c0_g1_i1:94-2145(-)